MSNVFAQAIASGASPALITALAHAFVVARDADQMFAACRMHHALTREPNVSGFLGGCHFPDVRDESNGELRDFETLRDAAADFIDTV